MNTKNQIKIFLFTVIILLIVGGVSLFFYQTNRYSDVFFEYSGFAVHKVSDGRIEEYEITLYVGDNKQPYTIKSRYNPQELEDIKIYEGIQKDILKEKLYVTMDPKLSSGAVIAFAEINKYLENPYLFNLPTLPALTSNVENNDLPIITCENVNQTTSVVLFKIGDKTEIYGEDGCIILEASLEDDLIKLADRLSLTTLGIMEP
ncbi:MAG: hypothetical protein ABIB47_00390 [Candidatus Woesearchaeota archaeon]